MKELVINHFLDYEFVYIFLFCSLIFLFVSIFIKQKTIKKLSILLFSIFVVFSLFELTIAIFYGKNEIEYNCGYFNKIINNEIDVHREIKFHDNNNEEHIVEDNKNLNNYDNYRIIYDAVYSTYNNGFRQTKGNINSEETYIFLGCSFVFGDGLNDDETLPFYFSKKFNFKKNVINCGMHGISINAALNVLNNELFLPLINNKNPNIKHCFYSFMCDSLNRNFRYEGKCLDGCLYKNNKCYIPTKIGKIKYIFARSYIFRKIFVPIIDEYFYKYYEDYMIESLKEINKIVEEKYKSRLTIIVWDIDKYNKEFIEKLKQTSLDIVWLSDKFNLEEDDYRIKYDHHPTAKANKEIAEILYNHIKEHDKIK